MISELIQQLTKRHGPQGFFPPLACLDDKTFLLEDTKKNGYLGITLFGDPLSGMDESTMGRIRSVLSSDFPAGTYIQFNLLNISDITTQVDDYLDPKIAAIKESTMITESQKVLLSESAHNRAAYFLGSTKKNVIKSIEKRLGRQVLMISLKVPCSTLPREDEIRLAEECFSRFQEGLKTVGLQLDRATITEYLALLRACFMPDAKLDDGYEPDLFLRDQILPPGFVIDTKSKREVDLNGMKFRMLSVKRPPKFTSIGLMNYMIGDPGGKNSQIPGNYMLSYTLHYPEPNEKANSVRFKYGIISQQADGPLAKLVPRIRFKKDGFDVLMQEMDQGAVLCESQLTMTIYSRDSHELQRTASSMSTFYAAFGMEMVEDSLILWPMFLNHLPLFPSPTSTALMRRFRSMAVSQAMQFLPILGEWSGSKGPAAHIFTTRRGGVFKYDLYHSDSNYNAVVVAQSGAGKSVLTQKMVEDYLASGAKVWVVDIGRSYEKQCKVLGGEFIRFNDESKICLNPFTNVNEIDDEMEGIASIIEKMAAPRDGLGSYERAKLEEAIKAQFMVTGTSTTPHAVAMYLQQQQDSRVRDLGTQLFSFTASGQHNNWFNGENNLNFKSNFVVLELEELNGKGTLQQIVLMMLMAKIQHEMYLTGNGIKKVAIFDESWALFADKGVAKFLEHGYRRFRKYEGAAVVVLQSLLDFYKADGMSVIADNSAHKIILSQQASAIDEVCDQKRLSLDDYGRRQLKTVHTSPGNFSEIMFYQNGAWGIARLALTRFEQVMYATKGPERHEILARIEAGENAAVAIKNYIERNG